MRRAESFRLLRGVRLFQGADDESLARVAASARSITTTKNQVVIARGERAEALYVIGRGRFKVSATDPAGHSITLNVLGSGDLFGEVALVDGRARSADVVSLSHGTLVVIERASILELARECPAIGWTLAEIVARRLRRLTERMEDRAFLDLERRLAKRLVEAAEDVGATADGYLMPGIAVALTQQDLAEMVDASRERVNRRLAEWAKDGVIAIERRRVRVLRPDALRRTYEEGVRSAGR